MSRTRLGAAAVLLVTLAVTAAGTRTLPIDDHETFVVQTAQEMRERGDWIVPHFHGTPRLTKPPLSYWITAGIADAMGADRVQPWHGRAPSIAAAIGLVALTMLLARLLVDDRTALVAGVVTATSVGIFRYAHNARPDMLYAFWCTVMIAAFVWGFRRAAPGRAPAWILWAAAGLATLTKGPQLPAMLLGAFVLVATSSGWSVRRLAGILRPASGAALAVAIAAPWWWAVDRALPHGLAGTQLAGGLLLPSWRHLLDPYFFYRPLALLAPSIAIAAPALLHRRWPVWNEATRLLLLLVVVPAALLSFGPQHRPHYMVPLLAPLGILVALTIARVLDGGSRWVRAALVIVWAATVAIEVGGASSTLLWSRARFAEAAMGAQAGARLAADVPLAALDTDPIAMSWYAGRPIRRIQGVRQIPTLLDAVPGTALGLITPAGRVPQIPDTLAVEVLARAADPREGDLVLARVTRRASGKRVAHLDLP